MVKKNHKRYQSVIITLSNGDKVTFTGPEQVSEGDMIRSIQFTEAFDLPGDMEFENYTMGVSL